MQLLRTLVVALIAYGLCGGTARGDDDADANAAFEKATKLHEAGKYVTAAPLYEKALRLTLIVYGESHSNTAMVLNNLGNLYSDQAKYAEAEPLHKRSLKIREAALGKDHPDVAQSLYNLAYLYGEQRMYAEAEPLHLRSLRIREAALGKEHPDVAATLNNLANLYHAQAKYADAEMLYLRSLKIKEASLGKDHPDVAASLNNLANVYDAQGKYGQAEPLYKRGLKILESAHGKNHPDVAVSLYNLAEMYRSQGKCAEAEPLHKRSLKIRETALGKDHPDVAHSLNGIAELYRAQDKYAEAEPLYLRSLKIHEIALGKEHPDVAMSLNNIAGLYNAQGKYAEAELLYQRSLKIYEAALGKDHPEVTYPLLGLASVERAQAHFDQAEPLIQRAIEIRRVRLGKDHPDTSDALSRLASLYARQARNADAIRTTERALRSLHRHTATVLPVLSEKEQLDYLERKFGPVLRNGLSLALSGNVREENLLRMASWLLNSKGVALEALSERLILARNNTTREASAALAKLDDVRRNLARLTLGDKGATPKRLEELREKEKTLEASLQGFDTRSHRDDPWFEMDELRQKLPAKAVFIDITRFAVTDFKKVSQDKKPQHYVAFLTTATGDVEIVDLGAADAIDDAVTAARNDLAASPKRIKADGEPEAEKALRRSLDALAKLVLQPLLPHIGKSEQWIISPDSNLWLVPWAALPLDATTYAVEKHRIQYVVSGRDLILNPLKLDRKPTAPIIIADPDFDLATGVSQPAGTRGLSEGLKLGSVNRLPGTAVEAEAVTPKLKQLAGVAPLVFTDGKAVTGAFRAAKAPRVVIFATHGFFLPEQEKKVESPLLRCGLLLAGCNRAGQAKPGEDTGVLTGLEIVGTDLRGTEMVVLSACETGLGDVKTGEGVAGLRQAFQLAGAESVVATLWQIPDVQSAQLMVGFFDHLTKKLPRDEALRASQLEQIKARRDRFGAAHPFFWAAYTVTGQVK